MNVGRIGRQTAPSVEGNSEPPPPGWRLPEEEDRRAEELAAAAAESYRSYLMDRIKELYHSLTRDERDELRAWMNTVD
jgi:hypothetical protein